MTAILLALQLLASAGPAGLGHTPPALGAPHFVQLTALAGLPADSTMRAEFTAGFRSEFAADQLASETRSADGTWASGPPVMNRFRLLEGSPADDAWTLHVVLGSPPPLVRPGKSADAQRRSVPTRRTSRGMIAALEVTIPQSPTTDARTTSARVGFAFPATGAAADAALGVPATGYAFPWGDAGRAVARLALEELLRASGDMSAGERCVLAPAVRSEAGR